MNPVSFHSPTKFSADENTLVIDGHKYKAVDGVLGKCTTCVGAVQTFGCRIWRESSNAHCQPHTRKDGRSIIWVPAVKL